MIYFLDSLYNLKTSMCAYMHTYVRHQLMERVMKRTNRCSSIPPAIPSCRAVSCHLLCVTVQSCRPTPHSIVPTLSRANTVRLLSQLTPRPFHLPLTPPSLRYFALLLEMHVDGFTGATRRAGGHCG